MSVSISGEGSIIGVDQGINVVGLTTLSGGLQIDDSIVHTGDDNTKIRFPAADTFSVETAGTERLRITAAGLVGIGTAVPFNNTSDVDIRGGSSALSDGGQIVTIGVNTKADNTPQLAFGVSDADNYGWIRSYASGVGGKDLVFASIAENVRITAAGSVGINTTVSPSKVTIGAVSSPSFNRGAVAIKAMDTDANCGTSGIYIEESSTDSGQGEGYNITVNADGDLNFHNSGAAAPTVTFSDTDNVGINTTGDSAKLAVGNSNGNVAFRVRNLSAGDSANQFQIWPRSSGSDNDAHTLNYYHENGYPLNLWNYAGTSYNYGSVHAGRTRSNANSPIEYYRHGAHSFSAFSARTDDQQNYRSRIFMRPWDANDHGDRNIIAYYDSGSDTDSANSTSDMRFGVKADGAVQGQARFFSGRVESDAATPTSVYGTGRGGIYGYDNSSTAVSYLLAEAGGSSSTYFTYNRTSNSDVQWLHRTSDGRMYVDATSTTFNGADYAEYFEWSDGNPNNEDRAGYTVVLKDENKIGIATAGDSPSSIIGVISGAPAIVGDGQDLSWRGKWKRDEFGREETTPVQYLVWNQGYEEDENGNKVPVKQPDQTYQTSMEGSDHQMEVGSKLDAAIAAGSVPQYAIDNNIIMNATRRVKDPLYDETKEYVSREFRQEWSPVGLVGKLVIHKGQVMGDRWIKMKDINEELEQWLVR